MTELDLSEFESDTRGPTCGVSVALGMLSGEQLEKAKAALLKPHGTHSHVKVASVLSKWTGRRVQASTVSRHRNGQCACD